MYASVKLGFQYIIMDLVASGGIIWELMTEQKLEKLTGFISTLNKGAFSLIDRK